MTLKAKVVEIILNWLWNIAPSEVEDYLREAEWLPTDEAYEYVCSNWGD